MRLTFGDFVFDRASRQLLCAGKDRHLEPKAFELLELLLARRPEVVSKIEIRDRLWPGTFVSESTLTRLAAQVRRALGDDRRVQRFIRTVHGSGYAFSGVAHPEALVRTGSARWAPRVEWEKRVTPLSRGANVLGRAEDVVVRVDAPGVSRHHARIVVADEQATLEDLGSKNGTYLREQRVETPALLGDGDTFRLGRLLLVFRSSTRARSTRTEPAGRPDR